MLGWEIAGSVAEVFVCQPLLHRSMDDRIQCNPAPTPKVHAEMLRPDSRGGLYIDYFWPKLSDPPPMPKGLVLILCEWVTCHVGWFPSKNGGLSILIHSKSREFCLANHPLQSNLGELALRFGIAAANI